MTVNNGQSHNNTNILKRDVSDIIYARAQGISQFVFDAMTNGASFDRAKNFKHEWINVLIVPQKFIVKTATGTTIEFDGKLPKVDYVLSFETADGTETSAVVLVKSLAGSTATVEILAGAITDITAKSVASVVSDGTPEGRDFTRGGFQDGDTEYNFTQNFDEGYTITGSMQQMDAYGEFNHEEVQQEYSIIRYLQKLTKASLKGVRYSGTNSMGQRISTMGGIDYFVNKREGNVLSVTGTPTLTDFQTITEMIAKKGGDVNNLVIYAHTKHAEAVNKFNTITGGVTEKVRGGVPEFVLLPAGGTVRIKFDANLPTNKIYFLNKSGFGIIPLGDRNGYFGNAITNADSISRPLIAEPTLVVRNALVDHGVIVLK